MNMIENINRQNNLRYNNERQISNYSDIQRKRKY